MSLLRIENVIKRFGNSITAVDNLTLHVASGEIVALLGPSGCGKTTLLRLVAGLEQADTGTVYFFNEDLANRPVHQRGFGYMFQDFALFPHRTVGENIAFGVKMSGHSRAETEKRVDQMLELVNLRGYGHRSVLQLSGGERQRVALARSLAPRPQMLMLDEPLGSLDRTLRDQLMDEIRTILVESAVTALYVTHDQEEAFTIADRVVVMNRGQVVQDGLPYAVFSRPKNSFVARFLGFKNLLPAFVSQHAPETIQTPIGRITALSDAQPESPGLCVLLLRPDGARLAPTPDQPLSLGIHHTKKSDPTDSAEILLAGQLTRQWYHGDHFRVELTIPRSQLLEDSSEAIMGDSALDWTGTEHFALQFDLMVLQPTTKNDQQSQIALPPLGTELYLRLHPNQLVLLPSK